jgi:type I restriction enzyme M protein
VWPAGTVLVPKSGASTFLNHRALLGISGCVSSHLATITSKPDKALPAFLYYMLINVDAKKLVGDQDYPSLRLGRIGQSMIPLPPLFDQEKIVIELDRYEKVVDGARQVVMNYKPQLETDPKWQTVEIGSLYGIRYGVSESIPDKVAKTGIKIISTAEMKLDGSLDLTNIRRIAHKKEYEKFVLKPDTLLFNWRNAPKHVGKTALFERTDDRYIFASFLLALTRKSDHVLNKYAWFALNKLREEGYFKAKSKQAVNQTNFNASLLGRTKIPLPPLGVQRQIVAQIEEEQQLVQANRRLIELFEAKIRDRIKEVWGE